MKCRDLSAFGWMLLTWVQLPQTQHDPAANTHARGLTRQQADQLGDEGWAAYSLYPGAGKSRTAETRAPSEEWTRRN